MLENGLARHSDAPPAHRLPALVYLTELRIRTGDREGAAALLTEIESLPLTPTERESLAKDLATATELSTELSTDPAP